MAGKCIFFSLQVQSNSYTSGGSAPANGGSRVEYQSSTANQQTSANSAENRPGSRLKANIDELDTLLSDLNNAQTQRSTNSQQHETSSEDYGEQSSTHLQVSIHILKFRLVYYSVMGLKKSR